MSVFRQRGMEQIRQRTRNGEVKEDLGEAHTNINVSQYLDIHQDSGSPVESIESEVLPPPDPYADPKPSTSTGVELHDSPQRSTRSEIYASVPPSKTADLTLYVRSANMSSPTSTATQCASPQRSTKSEIYASLPPSNSTGNALYSNPPSPNRTVKPLGGRMSVVTSTEWPRQIPCRCLNLYRRPIYHGLPTAMSAMCLNQPIDEYREAASHPPYIVHDLMRCRECYWIAKRQDRPRICLRLTGYPMYRRYLAFEQLTFFCSHFAGFITLYMLPHRADISYAEYTTMENARHAQFNLDGLHLELRYVLRASLFVIPAEIHLRLETLL